MSTHVHDERLERLPGLDTCAVSDALGGLPLREARAATATTARSAATIAE